MKKLLLLATLLIGSIGANAMPFENAQREALFLTDKMAYELGLDEYQYEAVFEINLDYFISCVTQTDVYGIWWERRNADLKYILTTVQYYRYINRIYFYRPLTWRTGAWYYPIYTHYTNRTHFYRTRPTGYGVYMGGNNRMAHDYYANRPPVGRAGHGNPEPHHNGNMGGNPPANFNNPPANNQHGNQPTNNPTVNARPNPQNNTNVGGNNSRQGNSGRSRVTTNRQSTTTTTPTTSRANQNRSTTGRSTSSRSTSVTTSRSTTSTPTSGRGRR